MTYNTSLKCTTEFLKVYTNTSHDGFGDDVYRDIVFDQIFPDPSLGSVNHSVEIVEVSEKKYIQLGANKHYVILGCIGQGGRYDLNQVIAVDSSGTVLTESDGFFNICRNYGNVFPTCTDSNLNSPNLSTTYLRYGQSRNYTFKIIKSTGNADFKFRFRGFSSRQNPLSIDSQVLIIEMSE